VNGTENDLWIVIPTADRHQYLESIFENSLIPRNQIVIVRTTSGEEIPQVHNIWDLEDFNIHRWWNKGINFAQEHGAKFVAVLNDDVQIAKGSLQNIVFAMKDSGADLGYPELCFSDICGYALVLRIDSPVIPDEQFRWLFGANDLRKQAMANNGYVSAPSDIKHLHPNETTVGKFFEATVQDGERYYAKWNTTSRF